MKKSITIGTRESELARMQSQMVATYIKNTHPELEVNLLPMKTTGDLILDKSLDQIGGKGLFVKELDRALMDGRSELSVHSLKDMPVQIPEELPLLAFSEREDPRDVLVLPVGEKQLDVDKPIGCSSLRRKLQLQEQFPEMAFADIRGNLQTRLKKLDEGQYSGLVLAAAGLIRLGLTERIARYFSIDECLPAAGQGILAVQGRRGLEYSYLDGYDNLTARLAAVAERAYIRELNGGCSSPHSAHAFLDAQGFHLRGLYYEEQTQTYRTGQLDGQISDEEAAREMGQKLADSLQK